MEEFVPITELPNPLRDAMIQDMASYSIGFFRLEDTKLGQNAFLLGSGTLVAVGDTRAVLTAHHVVRTLPRSGRLGILLSKTCGPHTIDTQGLAFLEIARGTDDSSGPDLGAVVLAPPIASAIAAKKRFYNLAVHRDQMLQNPPDLHDGVWIVHGFIDEGTERSADPGASGLSIIFYSLSCAGGPYEEAVQIGDHDYFAFPVSLAARSVTPRSFGGMSGGGLWQVPLTRDDQGELVSKTPVLSGVVFYQEPTTDTQCGVKCHGRVSVYQSAFNSIACGKP